MTWLGNGCICVAEAVEPGENSYAGLADRRYRGVGYDCTHRLPDEWEAMLALCYVAGSDGDHGRALELAQRALRLASDAGDRYQRRRTLHALGGIHAALGDLDSARALGEQSVEIGVAANDDLFVAHAAHSLGDYALRSGDLHAALGHYDQAARAGWRVGNRKTIAYCLAGVRPSRHGEASPSGPLVSGARRRGVRGDSRQPPSRIGARAV